MKKLLVLFMVLINLTACGEKTIPTGGGELSENEISTTETATVTSVTEVTTTVTTTAPPPPPPKKATIAMAGDILFHTQVWRAGAIGDDKYDFNSFGEEIKPFVEEADLAICNLECPVDVFGNNQNLSSYPQFNNPLEILDFIKYMGFDAVTTANNHAFDKGFDGLCKTLEHVDESGLLHNGTNATAEDYDKFLIQDVNGINVALISYSQLDNGLGNSIPKETRSFAMRRFNIDDNSLENMKNDIAACREQGADIVITALHWGAEYVDKPTDSMRNFANNLAENGADIILGGHSHCVQPAEWVETSRGESLVMYSLGNFFIDQRGLDPPQPKTSYGVVITATITETPTGFDISAEMLPTYTYRYHDTDWNLKYNIVPVTSPNPPDEAAAAFEHVERIVGSNVLPVSS